MFLSLHFGFAAVAARAAAFSCAALALAGCSSIVNKDKVFGLVTPYKVEVVQGNVITSEQAALIKPGQTRTQVRDILGSPLLTDVFHADRWDYIFTIQRQGAAPQRRQVTVMFDGDKLKSIDAPELPAERDFVASIDTFKKSGKPPPLALNEEQMQRLPAPSTPSADAPAATPVLPARTYPPLETR